MSAITDIISHEGKNIQIFLDEQGNVIFKNMDEDKIFASVNVAEKEEDMYGEWTCDDCGCEVTEYPDEDLPFCEDCYNDLEECEDCGKKFKESDGVFKEEKFRCYDCHEKESL